MRSRLFKASAFLPILAISLFHQVGLAADVNTTANWGSNVRTIGADAWGINAPPFMDPSFTANANWMKAVKDINLAQPLTRIHGWGMLDSGGGNTWMNADRSWNATKIGNALRPVIAGGHRLIINIPDGPRGGNGNPIDPDLAGNPDKVAAWLAQLVRIVNIDNKFGVKYWEIPNEREIGFAAGGLTSAQMATFISKASKAMKAVDPSIKIGGPATSWINEGYIKDVVARAGMDIDFITVHRYDGGNDYGVSTLESRYNSAANNSAIAGLRIAVDQASPSRRLPIFLSEYNISWEQSPNNINFSNEGAVWDALVAIGVIRGGADGSQFWEVSRSSWHSLIGANDVRYPMSNYLTLLNKYFVGSMITTSSSNTSQVDIFGAKTASSNALMLINRYSGARTVDVAHTGGTPSSVTMHVIDASGYSSSTVNWPIAGGVKMNGRSIVFLVSGTAPVPNPTPTPTPAPTPAPTPTPVPPSTPVVKLPTANQKLVLGHSKKCLDVSGVDGLSMIQFDCNGQSNQTFKFTAVGSSYQIVSVGTGKCIGTEASSSSYGARIQALACSNSDTSRLWTATIVGSNYQFKNVKSGMCANQTGNVTTNSGAFSLYPCGSSLNEQFTLGAIGATPAPAPVALRIDVGSSVALTNSSGVVYQADRNFVGGSVINRGAIAIANTSQADLYRTERYCMSAYNIPVTDGSYDVTLHFAETYLSSAGQRTFDVSLEGVKVLLALDVFSAAGGKNRALARTFSSNVVGGVLNIDFKAILQCPIINGIEVVKK